MSSGYDVYERKPTGVETMTATHLVPEHGLDRNRLYWLIDRLRKIELVNGKETEYDADELADIIGGETNKFWALTTGLVRPKDDSSSPAYEVSLLRESLPLTGNHTALDDWYGSTWYYHWRMATNLKSPLIYAFLNYVLLDPNLEADLTPAGQDLISVKADIISLGKQRITKMYGLSSDVGAALEAQLRWCLHTYCSYPFRHLRLIDWHRSPPYSSAPIPPGHAWRPANLSKQLLLFTVLYRMWQHVTDARKHHWPKLSDNNPGTDFPVFAMWLPGNPAHVLKVDLLSFWDCMVGKDWTRMPFSALFDTESTGREGYVFEGAYAARVNREIFGAHFTDGVLIVRDWGGRYTQLRESNLWGKLDGGGGTNYTLRLPEQTVGDSPRGLPKLWLDSDVAFNQHRSAS